MISKKGCCSLIKFGNKLVAGTRSKLENCEFQEAELVAMKIATGTSRDERARNNYGDLCGFDPQKIASVSLLLWNVSIVSLFRVRVR